MCIFQDSCSLKYLNEKFKEQAKENRAISPQITESPYPITQRVPEPSVTWSAVL